MDAIDREISGFNLHPDPTKAVAEKLSKLRAELKMNDDWRFAHPMTRTTSDSDGAILREWIYRLEEFTEELAEMKS